MSSKNYKKGDNMETLYEIKEMLNEIPDESLGAMFFGLGEGCEDTISIVAMETGSESPDHLGYPEIFNKYSGLSEFSNLVHNVGKAQLIVEEADEESDKIINRLSEGSGVTHNFFENKKVV